MLEQGGEQGDGRVREGGMEGMQKLPCFMRFFDRVLGRTGEPTPGQHPLAIDHRGSKRRKRGGGSRTGQSTVPFAGRGTTRSLRADVKL